MPLPEISEVLKLEALGKIKESIQLVLEVTQEQAQSYTEIFKVEVASA